MDVFAMAHLEGKYEVTLWVTDVMKAKTEMVKIISVNCFDTPPRRVPNRPHLCGFNHG